MRARKSRAQLPGPAGPGDYRTAALLAAGLALLYALTAAPGITAEDSGDFVLGLGTLGVVHPPGYPLYTMLGFLFTKLVPVGSLAYRVNLFSGVLGAMACGLLFSVLRRIGIGRPAAAAAALALGVSDMYWAQCVVAETYAFNALVTVGILALVLRFNSSGSRRDLAWVGFGLGLGLAHHYPLLILASPAEDRCAKLYATLSPRYAWMKRYA